MAHTKAVFHLFPPDQFFDPHRWISLDDASRAEDIFHDKVDSRISLSHYFSSLPAFSSWEDCETYMFALLDTWVYTVLVRFRRVNSRGKLNNESLETAGAFAHSALYETGEHSVSEFQLFAHLYRTFLTDKLHQLEDSVWQLILYTLYMTVCRLETAQRQLTPLRHTKMTTDAFVRDLVLRITRGSSMGGRQLDAGNVWAYILSAYSASRTSLTPEMWEHIAPVVSAFDSMHQGMPLPHEITDALFPHGLKTSTSESVQNLMKEASQPGVHANADITNYVAHTMNSLLSLVTHRASEVEINGAIKTLAFMFFHDDLSAKAKQMSYAMQSRAFRDASIQSIQQVLLDASQYETRTQKSTHLPVRPRAGMKRANNPPEDDTLVDDTTARAFSMARIQDAIDTTLMQ